MRALLQIACAVVATGCHAVFSYGGSNDANRAVDATAADATQEGVVVPDLSGSDLPRDGGSPENRSPDLTVSPDAELQDSLSVDESVGLQSCSTTNACPATQQCFAMPGWDPPDPVCFSKCSNDNDCLAVDERSRCEIIGTGYKLCTLPCDPLAQTGCPAGTQCSLYIQNKAGSTNCTAVGAAQLGQPCSQEFFCEATLLCLSNDYLCHPLCDTSLPASCGDALTCQPMVNVGSTQYGVCLPP